MDNEYSGVLEIENKQDRTTVAAILYDNGYTVSPFRRKKDGRSQVRLLRYEKKDIKSKEGAIEDES